jgi:effector-binding domain-containing protein
MTTTTAAVIIEDALKENLIISEGETPSATMYADGLRMLNRLCDTLSNNDDFAYYASQYSMAMTGQTSFTIGPTGDLVQARPIKIDTAVVTRLGITYPVKVIDNQRYDDLTLKTLSGANTAAIYYEGTYPNGTVYCYPLSTGCTLQMRVLNQVKNFAATTTQIDMPEGYEDFLMLGLAIRMAPSYGRPVNPDTRTAYKAAKKLVMNTNQVVPTMELPNAVMGKSGSSYAAFLSGE